MAHDAVADHDCFIAGIDANVDVKTERDQPAGHFLQQVH